MSTTAIGVHLRSQKSAAAGDERFRGLHCVPLGVDRCYVGASNFISPAPECAPRMPRAGWEPTIEAGLRQKVEEVYEQYRISDFGIPPELLDMYRYEHVDRRE